MWVYIVYRYYSSSILTDVSEMEYMTIVPGLTTRFVKTSADDRFFYLFFAGVNLKIVGSTVPEIGTVVSSLTWLSLAGPPIHRPIDDGNPVTPPLFLPFHITGIHSSLATKRTGRRRDATLY